jgi:hypothetical protein
LEPVALTEPVCAAAGKDHICYENNLKQKEENTAKYLSVEEVTESEDKEGQLNCPVALSEGMSNIQRLILYAKSKGLNKVPDLESKTLEPTGNSEDKELQLIPEGLKLTQLQIL